MTAKEKKFYVGKIAFCTNAVLGLKDKKGEILPGGHYVYIRSFDGDVCDVNIVTSLERKRFDYTPRKITNVSYGNTYPIPRNDANFTKWSGINHDVIRGIKIGDLQDIGNKSIKKRHHYYIRKFLK